jgi:hypothetical protein
MATDQTPTPNRLIVTITVVTVLTLVAIRFVLGSYFTEMIEGEQRSKQSTPEEYVALRAEQQKALGNIDQAIAQLASKRADLIEPRPSDDVTPLTGWAKSPKALPKLPAPAVPVIETATDGGAPEGGAVEGGVEGDGGATHAATGDAGAHHVLAPPTGVDTDGGN